jgi:hypothetical protein
LGFVSGEATFFLKLVVVLDGLQWLAVRDADFFVVAPLMTQTNIASSSVLLEVFFKKTIQQSSG